MPKGHQDERCQRALGVRCVCGKRDNQGKTWLQNVYKSIQHSRFGIVLAGEHVFSILLKNIPHQKGCYKWRCSPKKMSHGDVSSDAPFQHQICSFPPRRQDSQIWGSTTNFNEWAQEQNPRAIVSKPNLARNNFSQWEPTPGLQFLFGMFELFSCRAQLRVKRS